MSNVAHPGVGVTLRGPGDHVGRPWHAHDDPTQRVDGLSSHVRIIMVDRERHRPRHPVIVVGTALALLALVTGQRMQRAGQNARVIVVERGNQVGQRILVDKLVKDAGALLSNRRLRVMQASSKCGKGGRSNRTEMQSGISASALPPELRHPPVEVAPVRNTRHGTNRTEVGRWDQVTFARMAGGTRHAEEWLHG